MIQRMRPTRALRRPASGASTRLGGARRPSGSPLSWSTLLDWIAALVPTVTVLTALTVWFGYQIVKTRSRYFGIDPSVLGYTTSDYVLRSVSAVLAPLLYLLIASIAVLWVHVAVRWALRRQRWERSLRVLAWVSVGVGVVCVGVGFWVVRHRGALAGHEAQRPWILVAGVVMLAYGPWVLGQLPGAGPSLVESLWRRLGLVLVSLVVIVSAFWSFSEYAELAGGRESFNLVVDRLERLPRVTVYSTKSLNITGSGVAAEQVTDGQSVYRWRYSGLRLLVRSADRYFMLPADWLTRDDVAIVLRDSPDLRFEFQPPEKLR